MADIVDRATRSRMMAGIGGKNTAPELAVRRFLQRAGFRFRLHRRDLPGRPDIVLAKYGAAVLVHGCFWHRHPSCRFATTPANNREFWQAKFAQNIARDRRNLRELRQLGWTPLVIWECEISPSRLAALARKIRRAQPGSVESG